MKRRMAVMSLAFVVLLNIITPQAIAALQEDSTQESRGDCTRYSTPVASRSYRKSSKRVLCPFLDGHSRGLSLPSRRSESRARKRISLCPYA